MSSFLICKSYDNLTKSGQRQINVLCFFQSRSLSTCFRYLFRTSQINKIKFTCFARTVFCIVHDNGHYENRMGSRTLSIHESSSHRSSFITFFHYFIHFGIITTETFDNSIDINTFAFLFVNF